MAQPASHDIPGTPGDLLRYARQRARKEQKEVGRELHVDQKTISRWEHGLSEPTISQWWHLARYLDAEWLIYPRSGPSTLYAANVFVAPGPQRLPGTWDARPCRARLLPVKAVSGNGLPT